MSAETISTRRGFLMLKLGMSQQGHRDFQLTPAERSELAALDAEHEQALAARGQARASEAKP